MRDESLEKKKLLTESETEIGLRLLWILREGIIVLAR